MDSLENGHIPEKMSAAPWTYAQNIVMSGFGAEGYMGQGCYKLMNFIQGFLNLGTADIWGLAIPGGGIAQCVVEY